MSDGTADAGRFRSVEELQAELRAKSEPQCNWGAKLRLNGEILPGVYCCSLREGHGQCCHVLKPGSFDAKATIVEWVDTTGSGQEPFGLDPKPTAKPIGRKDDSGKLRYDLVDPYALAWLVASLSYGVSKYSAENWRLVEDWRNRYYAALIRHLEAWRAGEDDDDESGLPHLANAMFCVMCLTAMSAPRDMKVVVSRTKEAIRRWRERAT